MVDAGLENPDILFQEAKIEMESVLDSLLFNNPACEKVREKWCAAVFGFGYQEYIKACKVRMEPKQDDSADFYLLTDNKEYPFQIKMRIKEGRKIGKEFKERASTPFLLTPYRPGEGSIQCTKWIYETVQKIIKKNRYSDAKKLNILIYANFEANNYNRKEIVNALNAFKDEFASIWVITNHLIASIFTNNDLGGIDDFKIIKKIWPPSFTEG